MKFSHRMCHCHKEINLNLFEKIYTTNDLIEFLHDVLNQTDKALYRYDKDKVNQIKELLKQADLSQCNRCDGIGIYNGCEDKDCATYILHKIIDIIEEN